MFNPAVLPTPAAVEFPHAVGDGMTRNELGTVILLVDDDPSVRTSTSRLLSAHGHTVFEAASAVLAVQRAVEVLPDVILMDLNMPNCTGIEAAREIKQRAQLSATPIIALSATPPDWTLRSALFVAVLQKPYLSSQLLEALATAVGR